MLRLIKHVAKWSWLLLVASATQAAVDYPHSGVNGITCFSCHDIHADTENFLRLQNPIVPQHIDDTEANNLCWSCHNNTIAPYASPHSSRMIDDGYGQWAIECITCHNPHKQDQFREYSNAETILASGAIDAISNTTITSAGAGWTVDEFSGLIVFTRYDRVDEYRTTMRSYRIVSNTADTLTIGLGNSGNGIDLSKAQLGDLFAIAYGRLVKTTIETPNSGPKTVKFLRATGANSFADSEAVYDGPCQACHTKTNHMRNDGLAPDQWHDNVGGAAGLKCTESCHRHVGGFGHGTDINGDRKAASCVNCHGHEAGTFYDPDATYPYTAGGILSLGRGTAAPHSTHTESSMGIWPASAGDDDQRGPGIYCSSCHDIDNMPTFNSGTDLDGDGLFRLDETDVCDDCHSPGGTYNGVDSTGESIGAKDNWQTGGVYNTDGSLKAGKEKWCAGCHDESASVIAAVTAPNVIGDEDAITNYGIGYGFYKTGHGLATGTYPASGALAGNRGCIDCHDSTLAHIDGEARTYQADNDNYQAGYRLADVDGGAPMDIPRGIKIGGMDPNDFALCFKCHDAASFITEDDMGTNFRSVANAHWKHLGTTGAYTDRWDSDWDGVTGDSKISCPACHNVHGSPSPRMVRHGELISTPGTTDKVPGLGFQYTPVDTYPTLMQSGGGYTRLINDIGSGTIVRNGICSMCHNDSVTYARTPEDVSQPGITAVYGEPGSDSLIVHFTREVYTNADATGALTIADFLFTDLDDARTITAVSHTAGSAVAVITLSTPLDASTDVGTDMLAASGGAIFDAAGKTAMDSARLVNMVVPSAPTLDWTTETNYVADGVNPESGIGATGDGSTIFTFRIKYTDADNEPASSVQVWIDEDDSGSYTAGEKYTMTAVDAGDPNTVYGKLYTLDRTVLPTADGDMSYRFFGSDGTSFATGPGTTGGTISVADPIEVPGEASITDAITAASDGDIILVDDGIYNSFLNYSGKNITIQSINGPAVTKLHGIGSNFAPVVIFSSGETSAVLDGFTIDNQATGAARGIAIGNGATPTIRNSIVSGNTPDDTRLGAAFYITGGGVTIENTTIGGSVGAQNSCDRGCGLYAITTTAPITITDSEISYNSSASFAAIYLDNLTTQTTITNSTISNNSAGDSAAGIMNINSPLTITNSNIDSNTASRIGGALQITGAETTTITGGTISNNTAQWVGALYITSDADVTIDGTTINGNTSTIEHGAIKINDAGSTLTLSKATLAGNDGALHGGALSISSGTAVTVTNTIFSGNAVSGTDSEGGAIINSGTLDIYSSTFAGNHSAGTGGGLLNSATGTATVTNSIFWDNVAVTSDPEILNLGSLTVTYSNVEGVVWAGTGNINQDPLFVTPAQAGLASPTTAGDFHIQTGSNMVDKGTTINMPVDDIDGDTRPLGVGPDMGADEKE